MRVSNLSRNFPPPVDWNRHLKAAETAWLNAPLESLDCDPYAPTRSAVIAFLLSLQGDPAAEADGDLANAAATIAGWMRRED